ncbi:MAG: phosphate ABC transporter ATP-binding protein PstB [Candidatus Wallbacteria bacterium]
MIDETIITQPIMKIKELDFYYGSFHAIKKVTMDILPRTIVALIGPSGCGKSTLLKILNRMCDIVDGAKVTHGDIIYKEKSIFSNEWNINQLRKQIGMVFQQPNPFPLSIRENIEYGPRVHGITSKDALEKIVRDSLESVLLWDHLKDKLNKKATELSPDDQQRLCIARLVATEPEILLMDEPCSTLDPIATGGVEELMQKLKEKYTIVIVTHNMQQAARVSDFTGFMLLGELIEYNKTGTLFSRPVDKRTDDYISGRYG